MILPYQISSSTHKRRQKTSNEELKRPQMTSNDLKGLQLATKTPKNEIVVNSTNKTLKENKKILKGGASQAETIGIDDEFLNKIVNPGVNKKKQ